MIPHHLIAAHHHNTLAAAHQASLKSLDAVAGLTEVWLNASRESLARCAGDGTLTVDSLADFSKQSHLPSFDSQLHACGQAFHVMTRSYADLVAIAEAYWHRGQKHLQATLHDIERHAPGGTEPAFAVAMTTAKTVEQIADEVAESSVDVAILADAQIAAGDKRVAKGRSGRGTAKAA